MVLHCSNLILIFYKIIFILIFLILLRIINLLTLFRWWVMRLRCRWNRSWSVLRWLYLICIWSIWMLFFILLCMWWWLHWFLHINDLSRNFFFYHHRENILNFLYEIINSVLKCTLNLYLYLFSNILSYLLLDFLR